MNRPSTRRFTTIAALFTAGLLGAAVHAADPKPAAPKKEADPKRGLTILAPELAGVDYKLQGEYEGSAGASKWGAQVIAMGDGKFHAAIFPGGLPGAGWDAKTRYESEGTLATAAGVSAGPVFGTAPGAAAALTFAGVDKVAWGDGHIPPPGVAVKHGLDATLAGDTLTLKTDTGDTVTLHKVARHSPTEGLAPPAGAIILFNGSNVDAFTGAKIADEPAWLKGTLREGGETKQKFTDYTLHVEFMLPFKPFARNQERGNSGVYHQHRYETQVLDSFGLLGFDNECGGVYTKKPADVNMCFPPFAWQTYDIEFTAARYDAGAKKADAEITVKHNGVLIHDHVKITGPTGGGQKEKADEAIQSGPLYLQNHGNPVYYRNVWIMEKK